jgi:hypothetical protein
MSRLLFLVASLVAADPLATMAEQADSKLVRVYVHTGENGERTELAARRSSVTDLGLAIKSKTRELVLVLDRDDADVALEIISRGFIVPRVVFDFGTGRPEPSGRGSPMVRAVQLRVQLELERRDGSQDFQNKNTPRESAGGWKSAAEDIAKQVQTWIVPRREIILASR